MKNIFIITLLLSLVAVGCVSTNSAQPSSPLTRITETPKPIILKPLLTRWIIGNNLTVETEAYSLSVHFVELTGRRTVIFYSLAGYRSEDLIINSDIQVTDDIGHTKRLYKVIPLVNFDGLALGFLYFEPRDVKAGELKLKLMSKFDSAVNQEIVIARLQGMIADNQAHYSTAIFPLARQGELEFQEYRISFVGWQVSKVGNGSHYQGSSAEITSPLATPTAIRPELIVTQQEQVDVEVEASFIFENTNNQQTHHLGFRLFANGSVIGIIDSEIIQPIEIYLPGNIPDLSEGTSGYPAPPPYP